MRIAIPKSQYKQYIGELAKQHHIAYTKTGFGEFAKQFTLLSDDSVEQDDVERQVIALRRAGIINGRDMLRLLHGYLKESTHV